MNRRVCDSSAEHVGRELELAGRKVLVTGAAGGIGQAIVAACVRQGARVAAVDRVMAPVPDGCGDKAVPFVADLTDPGSTDSLIAEVITELGDLEGLVNCAGVMRRGDLLAIDLADWSAAYAVNVDAVMRLCRAALPALFASSTGNDTASIVTIASQWGLVPAAGHIAYNSSKAAVVSLTRSLARDFGARGIRANSICPGEILTPMVESKLATTGTKESELAAAIPLGRLGRPREVAELTTFLLSERASFISGAAIEITGAQQVG
ncbi:MULTISPECIES: SDR family oxidoreductase [unclassified Brevibacterium]|uniref:SDR family NAD(P)-dependent oxidoreductase n=1 Tax=unclassified Brevibacterium TaxID=2614124 RepID=UPI0010F99A6E|nr:MULTISPECIES: SDR family oxidoreductase [unclassified Brevibacterium]MCM1011291.1 SDR family oxidoreductase [Brevibacterium sp. XM4083]